MPTAGHQDHDDERSPQGVPTGWAGDGVTIAPTQPAPGLIVLRVGGELDRLTVPRLATALAQAVAATAGEAARPGGASILTGAPRVVCALDEVTFLGAAALGVLARAAAQARARRVDLVVRATRRVARRPFELTDLHTLVHLVTDPATADHAALAPHRDQRSATGTSPAA